MAVKPVHETFPSAGRAILGHGHGMHIAQAALVQVAGTGMMGGMGAAPDVVGRHREDAQQATDPVADPFVRKKCAMAAIMLDQEQPKHEGRIGKAQHEGQSVAEGQRPKRQRPDPDEGQDADGHLEGAARGIGFAVPCQDPDPFLRGACRS